MIAWRSPDNGNGFLIHSEVSAGSAGLQLEAKDNILSVLGDGGSTSALQVINSPAGVNAITISNAVTGDLPAVTAHSITDLNVSLQLKPQGTGTVNPGMGLKLPNYTVATLPTCNAAYTYVTAAVSDATAPAYNGALTGGGAVKIPVMCDGAAWKAH
jgi:hypothetical protein